MLERYGEVCSKKMAATILGVCRTTVWHLVNDGVLKTACGGEMIDVRSICEYIEQPGKKHDTRRRRIAAAPRMEIVV